MTEMTILFIFGEELGWRGYLLPLWQTRFDATVASLLIGVRWFPWQLPLRSIDGLNSGFPLQWWGN
jgi:membrane protease YdiL (CAAX protease family)